MKSVSKSLLSCRTTHAKITRNTPVAIFNSKQDASTYGSVLHLAVKSGDADRVKAMFPRYPFPEDGQLISDTRFSVRELPYAPEVPMPEGAVAEEED